MPFTARQKKRLEKEGAPLAVRRFPRHPPPPHPTSTPNRLHVPDSPRRGDAPQGQTRHPTAGPQKPGGLGGGIRCARTDPISSRGQRKNPLRSRRDEERGGQYSNCCTARRIGGGGGERREEGMGTATPPGQGQPREREGCKGVVIRENEGRRGRKKINLKRKGGSRSGWDRLLAVSSLPEAGSNGHRPARRRGGPGGMVWLLLPPSFLHRDGSHPPRDPTPPRTSPDFLSLPPPPPPNLHTPPRVRPTAATLPAPLTDFMAEAMSSYLSACSARRARCSSCSRSPIAASVVTAGLGTLRPSEREEGGGEAEICASKRAGGASREPKRSRHLTLAPSATVGLASAAAHPPAERARRRLAPRAHGPQQGGQPRARCVPSAACAARASPLQPGSEPRAAAAACACALGRQRGGGVEGTAGEGRGRCSPAFYF